MGYFDQRENLHGQYLLSLVPAAVGAEVINVKAGAMTAKVMSVTVERGPVVVEKGGVGSDRVAGGMGGGCDYICAAGMPDG